jgi:hypothetical protein
LFTLGLFFCHQIGRVNTILPWVPYKKANFFSIDEPDKESSYAVRVRVSRREGSFSHSTIPAYLLAPSTNSLDRAVAVEEWC